MTDLRKAAEQALEALESVYGKGKRCEAAIEALRQALAQPEQEPVAMRYDFDGYGYQYIDSGSGSNWQTRIKDAEPLYAAPFTAPPSQRKSLVELLAATPVDETAKDVQEPAVTWDASAPLVLDCPRCGHCCQQRQWVGLTDEDKDAFWRADQMTSEEWDELFAAVEAKLKEKNT